MLDNEPGEQSQVAVDMPHSKGSRIAAVGTLFNEVWDTLQGKSAKPGSAVERQMQRFVTSLGADNFERRERTRPDVVRGPRRSAEARLRYRHAGKSGLRQLLAKANQVLRRPLIPQP